MDEVPLHPDTASAVLEIVGASGTEADFEVCLARFREATTPQEEGRYRDALATFDDPVLAARTFALATGAFRTQDAPYLIRFMLTNRANGPATWARVTEAWDDLVSRFPSNSLPRMLDGVRMLLPVADEVRSFVESHPLPAGGRTVEQILERLDANVAFGRREGPGLAGTLRSALDLADAPT
jgi:puromycin-sensitive aminopeptidase